MGPSNISKSKFWLMILTLTNRGFINDNNILVLEIGGQVRLVSKKVLKDKPVLQVSAFDPMTDDLWQTENGPDVYDERRA